MKYFPLSVIADGGISNKMMGRIMIPLNRGTHTEKKVIEENDETEFERSLIENNVSILEFCKYVLGGEMAVHTVLAPSAL